MKKQYLLLLLACLFCLPTIAQKKEKCSEEEFRNKKQTYLTEQAGLTAKEAELFFPIYFELQGKKKAINRSTWKKAKKGLQAQTTEEEYENILQEFIKTEEQNMILDKEYLKKYQSVLSNKKIFKVLHAEIKFNRNMLKILQEMDKK